MDDYLKVSATYNDGQGEADKSAQAVSEFQVGAAPSATNSAPALAAETATRSILEGVDLNRNVGAPVTATDADTYDADLLTYGLGGDDVESFSIVASSGQIKTKIALVRAHEATYSVTVTATDPFLASDTITVTINVTQRSRQRSGGGGVASAPPKPVKPEPEFDVRGS